MWRRRLNGFQHLASIERCRNDVVFAFEQSLKTVKDQGVIVGDYDLVA